MEKSKRLFLKQPMMRKVIYSLIPITLGAVYFFGWRTLVLMTVVTLCGILTEYLFEKRLNKPITEAVIVTSMLFTLTLPVSTPFWVAILGIVFGVMFAKEVFGGFGRNVFNPALVGRTFLYVCFPEYLTARWNLVASGFPGGFASYMTPAMDSITKATPLAALNQNADIFSIHQLFLGGVSGSSGETSALLILIAAIYLVYTKTADWQLMASPIIGFVALSSLLQLLNVPGVANPTYALFSGGFIFLSIFFVTEPITAPKTDEAKWIYGLLIGMITVAIRTFGIFVGGAAFAVLIMNTFVPIMDEGIKYMKSNKRQVAADEKV
ncbi:Na+-transporting NADH:ubiquinone oxidoreductase subunit B [Natronincola peptidivorans]|uniref:Na+-transporting NADH:ubiquinone oxidoreductase subunit B n=1 Tax=Natronincola peptidivorans TaxID=426128 RepID=A0A1I0FUN6_9FIRM|nr:RnfABCDGE type electron transport complex subunit D [Natronincola peptidivorans]SET62011.1 Na+-transporting NADH:ubiquinone oxidoreductase subunit B [Natronincola peptidivorans]